ncbi:MAG TPA: PEP-CTERM sorting domain-containing protein [Verrucomicrobiales bacterium]|nr:PEP-CTERM sorting domain-containing protein [Verrucomicrobiales bacterium]
MYSAGGPYSISGCTNFILGFSELSGVGTLYVEFGSSDGFTDEHRVDLTGPGEVFYSVADAKPNSVHTMDAFNVLRFVFEARSTNFSFTLDEIRLVPEPGAGMLLLSAGVLSLRRRKRQAE